ncbi:chitobiase/beta-hexosaminidase C-terminal domain-containing protein, partial [Paenibacillus typhae]|nr:chitobiase/beta-hexosaminidase C-terminal domain-containing protein [Paenibacillus typhae]
MMVISHRMQKWLSAGLAMLMLIGIVVPAGQVAQAATDNSNIVISQVYGGGGNSGAELKNDFIELYNPTDKAVSLDGWKVRYASASASGDLATTTNITVLSGTIAANGYYLIQQAAGTGGTKSLPAPDATGTILMGAAGGKVDLVNSAGVSVDMVGAGAATAYEGSGPTGVISATLAAVRKTATGAPEGSRGLDTDNNANDFVVQTPDPRNSSYGIKQAVEAVTASPASNAWPQGTAITLNTATVGASVYAAVYIDGASAAYTPYSGPILLNAPTTIKAYASVSDEVYSTVSTFDYTLLEKQSIAAVRPADKGDNVWTEGVVTRIDGAKMYIQDKDAAIVLYGFPAFAQVGDRVEVQGAMDIYSNLQELKTVTGLTYKVTAENAGVPAPKLITAADLSAAKGEAFEAQLVTLKDVTIDSKVGSSFIASQGSDTFTIYSTLAPLTVGKHFDQITGVIEQFNATYQFIPLGAESLVEELFSVIASPGAGPIIIGGQVTLSSPTAGATVHYTIDGATPTASSPLYTTPITVDKDIVIKAIAVLDGQTSKVYTFEYKASEQPRIHDIQGESHTSSFAGQTVTDVEGIVTELGYTFANGNYKGFFIQDPKPDNNINTSEGIFVYSTNASLKPAIGDHVAVTGLVSEYNEGSSSNLTSTQITLSSIKTIAKNVELPAAVVLGKGGRVIPDSIIDNDGLTLFQPSEDAADFYESLEGMRVTLPAPTIISPYWTSGSGNSIVYNVPVRVENTSQDVVTPAGGLVLKGADNLNPQRLLIAYGNPGQEVGTGDKFNGDVTGVIGYNNGNYKVIPGNGSLPGITPSTFKQETSTITVNEDKLLIASYNIENYYPGVGTAKIQKLAESITVNMKKPDIISVVEMQDSDGEGDNGNVEASAAELIQAIQAAGGPAYTYVDIAPVNNADGGAPGGNIRVGFLYNAARVKLSDSINGQKGSATQAVGYDAAADELTYNPGRIDPNNTAAFASSRKPLAAQFEFKGEKVIVIANHFNSKSGDNGPFGNVQPPVLSSEVQRHKIAAVVNGFVKEVLTANPSANIVALGDLNDFQFTQTATILKGNELDNLIDKLPLNERYTYTYDGNSQVLDHLLVSKNLTASAEIDVVHLNADFPESRGRVSDHDPVLAQLDLNADFSLRLLHTNDTHSHLETVVKRMTAIKQERTGNSILLDAGDVFSGTLYFTKFEGLADLEFMNYIGYDAMTFGNHEFDKGLPTLRAFIDKADFPFISSNI